MLSIAGIFLMGLSGCGKDAITDNTTLTTTQIYISEEQTEGTEAQIQKQGGFEITVVNNNSWESNDKYYSQLDGVIKNQTEENVKDWKVTITVAEGAKLQDNWNGTYHLDGTTLEITPVDYNTEVSAGGEVSFGFILETSDTFSPENVVLNISGKEYAMGEKEVDEMTSQETTEQMTTEERKMAKKDTSGTPVANHGVLSVKGTDIVDKNGSVFQLKGISTHGINWFPDYVNQEAFSDLSEYGVNAIRLAMYTADYNGYCSGGNQSELEDLIDKGVQACTQLGLYVIVDWHILNDNNPNQNKDAAKSFFDTMSQKYAEYDNIIYEICNEPNGGTTWEDIKSYAEEVIPVIRKNDKNAIIIVGTPNWSQDVDIASENPITGQENIVYAVHFYASTHKQEIRNKVITARENGLPVIVSECSICEASGNGSINYDEASSWMELINEYHLSFFAWNLSNKDEQSSILKSSVNKTSGFTKEDFSDTGIWFLEQFGK